MSNNSHAHAIAMYAMREVCRDPNGPLIQETPSDNQMAAVLRLISDALETYYWLLVYALVNAQEAEETTQ